MIISSLQLQNIRTHEVFTHDLSPYVTLITGSNGSGKTSIIEAMMIALQGTSFKGTDTEILRHESEWWRIDIRSDDHERTIKFDPSKSSGKKQFSIDSKISYRLASAYKYPVVLFEPDDLRLLHGSPSRRRQFIDRFLSQLDSEYAQALRKYERALKQRNALLKRQFVTIDDMFVWDIAIGEYGAEIIDKRVQCIEALNGDIADTYNTIAQSNDTVSIHYSHTSIDHTKQKLINELHGRFERDKLLGFTSVGPHRHDVEFRFNGKSALSVASRGEVRSIVLALKFLEVDIIERLTNQRPIILLDDVFGELDGQRQTHLATKFKNKQIVMTSASSTALLEGAMVIALD